MEENGNLFTSREKYDEIRNELKQKSIAYSQSRKNGEEQQSTFEEPLDAAAYVDSKYTDYVNGHNSVTEEDVLKDIENFENNALNKNDCFEDFPMNVRNALEDFKKR